MINHNLIAAITNPVVNEFGSGGDGGANLGLLMARLYRTAIIVGGLALLLSIAWGGLSWITAGGNEKKVEEAKDRITNGIIGMTILVGTAALAAFIGNALGLDLLNPSL
jgi:hypothetical protein